MYARTMIQQHQQNQARKNKRGPHAKFDQVYEKIRIQVNVRDTSISSNEGTGNFNGISATQGTNEDVEDETPSKAYKYDRIKAGFNVSYDSNSFQGIKNNLIQQTKVGQKMKIDENVDGHQSKKQ